MAIISDKMITALNFRIEQEEQSSRIYKAMSTWLNFNGFVGAASLFKKYSDEELTHADWAYKYMSDLNILPQVPAQNKPTTEFKGLPQIIALGFQHEVTITEQCKSLAAQAMAEQDHMTYQLALKYIDEQVGELGKFQTLLDMLNSFGATEMALKLLDTTMGGM
jgi:ferritin